MVGRKREIQSKHPSCAYSASSNKSIRILCATININNKTLKRAKICLIIVWCCGMVRTWQKQMKQEVEKQSNKWKREAKQRPKPRSKVKKKILFFEIHHLNPINEIIRERNLITQKQDSDKWRRGKINPATDQPTESITPANEFASTKNHYSCSVFKR